MECLSIVAVIDSGCVFPVTYRSNEQTRPFCTSHEVVSSETHSEDAEVAAPNNAARTGT